MATSLGNLGKRIVLATTLLGGCTADEPGEDDDGGMSEDSDDDGSDADGSDEGPAPADCDSLDDWDPTWVDAEHRVLSLVNQVRASGANCGGQEFGPVASLLMDETLRCAARLHSLDMAERNFFDHINPDGSGPDDRVSALGYRWRTVGENIAAGQPTPDEVMVGWLESPGHCQNIMSPDFTEIGIGYVFAMDGDYGHMWTQKFADPL